MQQALSSMAPQRGQAHLAPIRKLKVGFCIPHANVTGGLKMLLEKVGSCRGCEREGGRRSRRVSRV